MLTSEALGCSPVNCGAYQPLAGNPDLAGIGVIIGFTGTCVATLLAVTSHYILGHQPTTNPFDVALLSTLKSISPGLSRPDSPNSQQWKNALEATILSYSDTQLFTALAILTAGYTQLSCGLSTYHWQIIIYLAWFSSLTHLTTLTALRERFRRSRKVALLRVGLMGCLLFALAVALGVTGWVGSVLVVDVPAVCLFRAEDREAAISVPRPDGIMTLGDGLRQFNWLYVLLSLLFLLGGYVSRVVGLFEGLEKRTTWLLRTLPGKLGKKWLWCYIVAMNRAEGQGESWKAVMQTGAGLGVTAYVLMKTVYELVTSVLWDILWLLTCLSWAGVRLGNIWATADIHEERAWGFGQFLATLLLVVPALPLIQQALEPSATGLAQTTATTVELPLLKLPVSVPRDVNDVATFNEHVQRARLFELAMSWGIGWLVVVHTACVAITAIVDFPGGLAPTSNMAFWLPRALSVYAAQVALVSAIIALHTFLVVTLPFLKWTGSRATSSLTPVSRRWARVCIVCAELAGLLALTIVFYSQGQLWYAKDK